MNNENEIERMAKTKDSNRLEEIYNLGNVIADSKHFGEHNDESMLAQDILDAGYGNVKQAVKEFAERLKEHLITLCCGWHRLTVISIETIDNLIIELYGAD